MRKWPNYLGLGISPEQIPDLIRMVQDEELNQADPQSLEVWAPVHAWRALGQLRAEMAIEPLIVLLEGIDEDSEDWIVDELPTVFGLIGPAALPGPADLLVAPHDGMWAQATSGMALAEIGKRHPEAHDDCVTALTQGLESFASQGPGLKGFLISSLVDLKAVEAASLMEKAYAAGSVDIAIVGDWEDAQIELGLLDERQTPSPQYVQLPVPLPLPTPPRLAEATAEQEWKEERKAERRRQGKRKAKRKRQKEARRKRRKRK